ncbi:MAG: hypothetical protein GY936_08620 [Ignavibacteriae bacterium]|nr:hypothetical protein [Ignavibacteriota bacterium]
MKFKKMLYFSLLVALLVVGCSESDTVTEPEEEINYTEEISEYFPVNVGDSFLYNVDTLNQATGVYTTIGSRLTNVYDVEKVLDQTLILCNEDYNILGNNILAKSGFELTPTSLEFFADTNGVSVYIPDSLVNEIDIYMDESFKILEFPLVKNQPWKVYKFSASFGLFKFDILEVYGEYFSTETLQIEGFENSIETEKFKYSININIPDEDNPFVSRLKIYDAYVWFDPGFGVVKVEGCKLFIDPISGNGFNMGDSNKVVRHSLVSQ